MNAHEWKRELLVSRLREINDAWFAAFRGVDGLYHGDPVLADLVGRARSHLEADDLSRATSLCEMAERAIMERRRDRIQP